MAVSGERVPGDHSPGGAVPGGRGAAGGSPAGPVPPGRLVDAAGARLHVVRDGTGRPPVVLTSGLGGTWLDWVPVVPLLADRHEVVRFDRPGLGYSPPASRGPTLRAEADRIAALIRACFPADPVSLPADLAPAAEGNAPGGQVIVVAHSMAAFHAEALARIYPQLIGGLVLVDPSTEPTADFLPPRTRTVLSELGSRAGLLTGRAAGITRLAQTLVPPVRRFAMLQTTVRRIDPVPPGDARAAYGTGEAIGTILAELACYRWQATDLARLREELPFPAVPLVVLAATGRLRSAEARERWTSRTQQLARLALGGRHVEIGDSGHLVSFDRPDAIADAVQTVTDAITAGNGDT